MSLQRTYGEEQPGISLGKFTMRLPFIHYRFEVPDFVQGLLLCTVCLSIIPVLTDTLGMSFEVALAIVILNGTLYLAHVTFGDPVVPGWITPAIPLIVAHVESFDPGAERMQALIAFQMTFGLFCIVLGATGIAKKVVSYIPNAVQSAILLGAGFSAVIMIVEPGEGTKSFDAYPWTISICIGIAFYLLFAEHFKKLRHKNKILYHISNLGMMPALALAIIIGPMFGEIPWPTYDSNIFTNPDFATLFTDFTILGAIPIPSFSMFVSTLPLVLSAYIVVFGDILQSQALIEDAQKYRPDEKINYDPNRSHLIFGGRNVFMSIFGPDISMCGPLWAAMQVVVCERYKHGPKAMDSLHGGAGSFRLGTWAGYFIAPIVSTVKPILGIGLASTMLIQGYVSVRIGVLKSKTFNDLGIAGVSGAILATRGAAWGLGAAILLCLLIYLGGERNRPYISEEPVFPGDSPEKIAEQVKARQAEAEDRAAVKEDA